MSTIDTIFYSVCEDCFSIVANGFSDHTSAAEDDHVEARMKSELGERNGHWITGVEPTEEDPEGSGYEEFTRCSCELCNDTRGGSRYGVTLVIEEAE
jgi:hypothetical protein